MVPLTIFGYLMCNVLLAWVTLHQPYILTSKQTLSLPPPQNKNEWIHSVIFRTTTKNSIDMIFIQSDTFSGFLTISERFSICE